MAINNNGSGTDDSKNKNALQKSSWLWNYLTNSNSKSRLIIVLGVVWALAGLIAVLTSFVCSGEKGTVTQKVGGILLAMLLGPLYFFYPALSKTYCKPRIAVDGRS